MKRILLVALIVVLVLGGFLWYKLFRRVPTVYADPVEHFKYGSVGVEAPAGIPYWIWVVLPRVFADKLPGPGGYVALGATWEMGKELPIGFTKERIGVERVGVNCAGCHTATVRNTARRSAADLPGRRIEPFPAAGLCAFSLRLRPRFPFQLRHAHERHPGDLRHVMDRPDALPLRRYPYTRSEILKNEKNNYPWMPERPDWGPGRTDMNPFQRQVLRLPDDHTIGSTDIMPIWNQRAREGMARHSDGLNPTLVESARSAALAAGATEDSIDIPAIDRVQAWLMDAPAAKYPFAIDQTLAAQGQPIYTRLCADCHAPGGSRTGKVVPLAEIGTDPHRNRHWSQSAADAFNRFAPGSAWAFHQFRKTGGYLAPLLDGVWLRAPFLHNGSVPNLRELLEPLERSRTFERGCDIYDQASLGFACTGGENFRYDTSVPGNGNAATSTVPA